MTYKTDTHTTDDYLNFDDFQPALHEIIMKADTPLTIGIFGPWGSGKTSLLNMLREEFESKSNPNLRTLWFTAWKYDRHEALWRAFVLRVLDALYPRLEGEGPREDRARIPHELLNDEQQKQVVKLERLQESVYRPVEWQEIGEWTINWLQLIKESKEGALEIATDLLPVPGIVGKVLKTVLGEKGPDSDRGGAIAGIQRDMQEYHREQLTSMEQFEKVFGEVLREILGENGRLVVFVDDLDRCLPEKAIEVLEAIKLFLEVPGTVFVLGMDREVVQRGVETRYGALLNHSSDEREFPISGDTYLQKIIQIPFHLPPLAVEDMDDFLAKLEPESHDGSLDTMTRKVFARGLFANPRQAKRCLNIFRLLRTIAETRQARDDGGLEEGSIAWPLLAKTVVIQTQFPELYQLWRRYPTIVQTLEDRYARLPSGEEEILHGRIASNELEAQQIGAEPEQDDPETPDAQRAARNVDRSTSTDTGGGILAPFLEERQRYALLEQMLTYPPADQRIGEGKNRTHFEGLSRTEMQAYVRLAGTAATDEPIDLPDAPEDIMGQLLSGDTTLIEEGLSQIDGLSDDEVEPTKAVTRQRLSLEIADPQRSAKERTGAGLALGKLGDLRSGVGLENDLPQIDWCTVKNGPFLMGGEEDYEGGHQFTCSLIKVPYRISRYPITVAQFQPFIEEGGYNNQSFWIEAGWKWRQQENIDGPARHGEPFQTLNHPQIGVSWYEAMAYCNWLSSKPEFSVRLPSEAEWERAARHTDARIYPWNDEFSPERCNVDQTGIGSTSAVGVFPTGLAECGAADMSGNVWEWCSTKWLDNYEDYEQLVNNGADGEATRVLRGGSWGGSFNLARCAARYGDSPNLRLNLIGFRLMSPSL